MGKYDIIVDLSLVEGGGGGGDHPGVPPNRSISDLYDGRETSGQFSMITYSSHLHTVHMYMCYSKTSRKHQHNCP